MRTTILAVLVMLASCKKDKFTTAPQITYKSVNPNYAESSSVDPNTPRPKIRFRITDAEGDLGDTAYVHLKNLLTGDTIVHPFPNLQTAAHSNFQADVDVEAFLRCRSLPGGQLHIDTLYFEVYVTDFAKNKSNVITTTDPIYYNCR